MRRRVLHRGRHKPRHAVAALNGLTDAHVGSADSTGLNRWERQALELTEERSILTGDYHRHMPDTWVALDSGARRAGWLWIGAVGLFAAGITAATYAPRRSALHPSHFTAAGHWWWFGVVGSFWLAYYIYMVNLGYGRTRLSRDGMQFHTFFSRRFIAWGEVTQVKERRETGRSTPWSYIGVRVAGGRTERHVPGTLTLGSGAKAQKVLGQKLETIRSYWKNATDQDRGLR